MPLGSGSELHHPWVEGGARGGGPEVGAFARAEVACRWGCRAGVSQLRQTSATTVAKGRPVATVAPIAKISRRALYGRSARPAADAGEPRVYLDTTPILRALGLATDPVCEATVELLALLRNDFKVPMSAGGSVNRARL